MTSAPPLHKRLCEYFLACLARDDAGGVCIPVRSSAEPAYVELPRLELDVRRLATDDKLLTFARGPHRRQSGTLRLGYPVFVPRPKWEGAERTLVPLFLIDVACDAETVEPEWQTCALNLEALRELEGNDIHFAQHVMLEIEEGLGLTENAEPKTFAQIVERLKLLRPEWPWGTEKQGAAKALRHVPAGYLYERGLMLRTVRPYTLGLEIELQRLAQLPQQALLGTALGTLLYSTSPARAASDGDGPPLLEVLPMNTEQRAAVSAALSEPICTITGPPGTGKSQVVANLLINCAWQRRPTLFASKNHKAVDVVHERVNGLGPKPIVIRLGGKEHRHKLATHLTYLVEGTVAPETVEQLRREQLAYERLRRAFDELNEWEHRAISHHERVREGRQHLISLSLNFSKASRVAAGGIALKHLDHLLDTGRGALLAAIAPPASRGARLLWPLRRKARYAAFERCVAGLIETLGGFAPPRPRIQFRESDVPSWKAFLDHCERRREQIARISAYEAALRQLRELDLAHWAARRAVLQRALVEASGKLWHAWVATQPLQLSSEQRAVLADHESTLRSVLHSTDTEPLSPQQRRDYERLTFRAPEVISCFALTALSARNRVPFEAGYFDSVVFDESSQCDLASALPLLYRAKRAVIIGDPKQLRHISGLRRDLDATLLAEQQLRNTHAQWQYSTHSLFDLAHARVAPKAAVTLLEHYRSHPAIIGYSNRAFYQQSLRVHTKLPQLVHSERARAVEWIDVAGKAARGPHGSVFNPDEVRAVVAEVRRLVETGYRGSIGVVTPFASQAERIRRDLERDRPLWEKLRGDHEFQAATAHGFQGDERDLMIFSIVAAPGLRTGAERFLQTEAHVFNVALTRARAELRIVGHLSWCQSAPIPHLRDFAAYVTQLALPAATTSDPLGMDIARTDPSDEERALIVALEREGITIESGVRAEQYMIELAVTQDAARLAIGISDETPETVKRQQLKRQRLLQLGWDVMHFWTVQLRDDLPWCVARVRAWARARSETSPAAEEDGASVEPEIDAYEAAFDLP